ncbi:MAG: hypothetical protein LBU72_02360 [Burkholderiaceae bacterium]|nr:hypothetical protein [Burkholderiaceae bacterium]
MNEAQTVGEHFHPVRTVELRRGRLAAVSVPALCFKLNMALRGNRIRAPGLVADWLF